MAALAQYIISDAQNSVTGIDFSGLKNKSILVTGASGLVGTYLLAGLAHVPRICEMICLLTVCRRPT